MENQKKKSLNDILEDYQKLENELINNDGELSEELEKKLNLHEKELGDKLDGYEHFVRYLKSKVEYLKNMENHFSTRRKVLDNSIKRCKKSMANSLLMTGKSKLQTHDFNFSLGKSKKWSVNIDLLDESDKIDLVENGLAENIFQIKLSDLKTQYVDLEDEKIPEWITIEATDFIKVR